MLVFNKSLRKTYQPNWQGDDDKKKKPFTVMFVTELGEVLSQRRGWHQSVSQMRNCRSFLREQDVSCSNSVATLQLSWPGRRPSSCLTELSRSADCQLHLGQDGRTWTWYLDLDMDARRTLDFHLKFPWVAIWPVGSKNEAKWPLNQNCSLLIKALLYHMFLPFYLNV